MVQTRRSTSSKVPVCQSVWPRSLLGGELVCGLNGIYLCFPCLVVNLERMTAPVPVGEGARLVGRPCGFYSFTGTLTKWIRVCRN